MSMRFVANKRTACEVLREINDELQGDPLHEKILPKLREAEGMCKRTAKKLYEYNKNVNKEWWKANPDYEKKLKMRMSKNYLT